MKNILAFFIAIIMLASSCKPLENSVILANTKDPIVRTDITYSYSDDQIRHADNKLKKGWANRNDVQVLHVRIINNTEKTIHGSQLGFYTAGEQLEIVNNELASKKLKSKKFPTAVYIVPVFIVGYLMYAALLSLLDDNDEINGEDLPLPEKSEEAKDPLYKANLIQKELYHFNIAKQLIHPGEQISGFIALKSRAKIDVLDIEVRDVDYEVVGIN